MYTDGRNLLEQGKYPQGFKLLKQATEESPANTEFKKYYYRQKELWVSKTLREADTERINQNWKIAEQKYRDILEVENENIRAKEGLTAIETDKVNAVLIAKAEESIEKDDLDSARDNLKQVLSRDPLNAKAKAFYSKVQQKRNAETFVISAVKSKFKKPISLEFKSAPIKAVFELLSKSAGLNFILDC